MPGGGEHLEELSDELEHWFWHWFWTDVHTDVQGLSEAQRLQRMEAQRKELTGLRVMHTFLHPLSLILSYTMGSRSQSC